MEITLLILIALLLLCNMAILYTCTYSSSTQKKMLAIIKDLQDITNVEPPKELNATLTDIGNKVNLEEEAIENIHRTKSIWEEDGLDGEEIEDVYAR